MKKRILQAIGATALATLMLATSTEMWVSAQEQNGNEPTLVGSWDVRVTARDCLTGTPIPFIPIFPAMLTYNQGGTMQESDLGGPGVVRLEGHGIWKRQTGRQYSASFRFLNFAPDRTFLGTQVVRSAISLDHSGKSYTSSDVAEFIDPAGNVSPRGCATTTATRFE